MRLSLIPLLFIGIACGQSAKSTTNSSEADAAINVVKQVIAGMEGNDLKTVEALLTDDFTFQSGDSPAIDKAGFMAFQTIMLTAFSEYRYNVTDYRYEDGKVLYSMRFTGKHTGKLELPNMPVVEATQKSVELPPTGAIAVVKEGKLASLKSEKVEGGGMAGILAQLGVNPN